LAGSTPIRSTASSRSQKTQTAASSCREFPYQALSQKGADAPTPLKPAIPIRVHHPDTDQTYPLSALIDSGADATTLPDEWAEVLGIDLDECPAVKVKTGSGITFHPEWTEPLSITVAEHKIEVVRPRFAPIHVVILGRRDFFMNFKVEFDERKQVTRLTPYEE